MFNLSLQKQQGCSLVEQSTLLVLSGDKSV